MADRAAAPLVVGTAGHVDHGKTTLVEALTGIDTDRLAEEKRRGLSIELGFAELELAGGRSVSVIDVPGHERFLTTMVSGAGGVGIFVLVVAADEGVMPQTREHLAVLRALRVEEGVIAITRCDLADAETRALAVEEARELAPGLPIVEVSSRSGEGLERLNEEIGLAAARTDERRAADPAWPSRPGVLHVDRCFSLRGAGTVVTGTVAAGSVAVGQRLRLMPSGVETRARGIEVHGRPAERVTSGGRAAINLARTPREAVGRGDAVAPEPGLPARFRLDIELALPAGVGVDGLWVQALHGTRRVPGRAVELGEGLAQLRLTAPLFACAGDRLVLRRLTPVETLGGGLVIDPAPRRHGPDAERRWLQTLRTAEAEAALAAALERAGADGVAADPIEWWRSGALGIALARFDEDRWHAAIARALEAGEAKLAGGRLVAAAAARPAPSGPAAPPPEAQPLDRAALRQLDRDGLEPSGLAALAERLDAPRDEVAAALDRLLARGELARVKPDVVYPSARLAAIEHLVAELVRREGSITLAGLRDALGTSRKYAQAILEHLDARGVTVRQGDVHLPRGRRSGARPGARTA